jgi:methionyl-tRNA formyltransferase
LAARINGLFPWPACAVEIAGHSVRLGLADALASSAVVPPASEPGTVLGADAEGLLLATGRGLLRLRRLQRPGGRLLPAAEFLSGFSVPAGTRLPSQSMIDLLVAR